MGYRKNLTKLIFVIVMLFALPLSVLAANDVQVSDLTYFELQTADTAVLVTITADGGGQVTNFDVESNYIDITLDNLSTVTFRTNSGSLFLKITKQSGSDDYTVVPSCPTTVATLTGTGAQVVLRLQVMTTDTCPVTPPPSPPSGGGGGGGSYIPSAVSGTIKINGGASETYSSNVTLNLVSDNATQMMISNDPNFTGVSWENYSTAKYWSLNSGLGSRTVYALFKNSDGQQSSTVSASILVKALLPNQPAQTEACQVTCSRLTYDLYIINPDGSERHMDQTRWAKKKTLADGTLVVSFEDKGLDNNYTDVIVHINTIDCSNTIVSTEPSTASWHHQIKLKIFYSGVLDDDIVLIADDHVSPDKTTTININDNANICAAEEAAEEQPENPATDQAPGATGSYGVNEALEFSPTINTDKSLAAGAGGLLCTSGSLIKLPDDGNPATQMDSAVYYCGADGKRYVFPNPATYFTWYVNFSKIIIISPDQMAAIPLGRNATVRPGAIMVKFPSDDKVYAVAKSGILRWVTDEATARALYGADWNTKVIDLSDAFFGDYTMGDPIYLADVINPITAAAATPAASGPALLTYSKANGCQVSAAFADTMKLGDNGAEIKTLQQLLQCLGDLPVMYDSIGHFGPATEGGVKAFQAAKGISAAGYVGPGTLSALNKYVITPAQ